MRRVMEHFFWDYVYEPVSGNVTVRRWSQRGNLAPVVDVEYEELTWGEALDVLDLDWVTTLERLRELGGA